jgi:hypothetical protein
MCIGKSIVHTGFSTSAVLALDAARIPRDKEAAVLWNSGVLILTHFTNDINEIRLPETRKVSYTCILKQS